MFIKHFVSKEKQLITVYKTPEGLTIINYYSVFNLIGNRLII